MSQCPPRLKIDLARKVGLVLGAGVPAAAAVAMMWWAWPYPIAAQ